MKYPRKLFVLLVCLLLLLFVPSVIEALGGPSPSSTLNQAIGFALTLIGIFFGGYFALERLEKQMKEDRIQEIRQSRMAILTSIENWLDDVAQTVEDIGALRELSPKDEKDNKLIVSQEKIKPIAEKLLRLDYQWLTVFAKTADIVGITKGETKLDNLRKEQQSLIKNIYFVGSALTETRETIAKGNVIPGVNQYTHSLAEAKQAIDRLRLSYE